MHLRNQKGSVLIVILLGIVFFSTLYLFFNNPFDAKAVTDITACQTISSAGTYRLTMNMGTGGTCLLIEVNGVDVDGGGFTITGDIMADAPDTIGSGLQLTLRNMTVTGDVYARGYQSSSTGTAGGSITLFDTTVQGDMYATGGMGISLSQATLGQIAETGATGGAGGAISMTDSKVRNIYVAGGDGANGQRGFNGEEQYVVYGGAGGQGGNGGNGGTFEAIRSEITGSIYAAGGYAGIGGNGGDGFAGGAGADSDTIDGGWGNAGGQAGPAGAGGVGGVGGTVTLTDSTAISIFVDGRGGGSGGDGGVGGTGGNGGSVTSIGLNGGQGGQGGNGSDGGNGGNASNAGSITVTRSTVATLSALGGVPGPVGGGGNGGAGGNGGEALNVIGGGAGGNGGQGGNGGSTGMFYGYGGNGGSVTVVDSTVTDINIAGGQAGSPSLNGNGGQGGNGGGGASGSGSTASNGSPGSYLGNTNGDGYSGSISLLNNPPSIHILGSNPMTITVGSSFVDPGATVTDAKDKNLSANVSGSVNTAVLGEYVLTYSVTDTSISPLVDGVSVPEYIAAAQSDLKTRTVKVVSQSVPILQSIVPGASSGAGFTSSGGSVSTISSQSLQNQTSNTDTNSPVLPKVPVTIVEKIISLFTGRKTDSEIVQIISTPETQAIMDADLSQKQAEPFDNSLEQNLHILGVEKCPVFTETIIPNNKNNNADQVRVWQKFYNHLFGAGLEVTGGYDSATIAETNRFQTVFKNTILLPWGIEEATGNIYITTRYAANTLIGCKKK